MIVISTLQCSAGVNKCDPCVAPSDPADSEVAPYCLLYLTRISPLNNTFKIYSSSYLKAEVKERA